MSEGPTVTVLGDLNVELSARLDGLAFAEVRQDTLAYCPVEISVGGTAANFALAASEYFGAVHVIGKLGEDELSRMVVERLEAKGIQLHRVSAGGAPTGLGIYIRDASRAEPRGVRLLMIRSESANNALLEEDVERFADVLLRSDLLILDGYCLLHEPRRSASFKAMELARRNNVKVALDIVPHDAHALYNFGVLKSMIEPADIFIVEVRTIRHFMGLDVPGGVLGKEVALETAKILRDEFAGKSFYLRFGIGNIDQSLFCRAGGKPEHSFTGYANAAYTKGFGDILAARELAELLGRL